MHVTASVFINYDEKELHKDYEKGIDGLTSHELVS